MARKQLDYLPGLESGQQHCFAFYTDKAGRPCCSALVDIYCLKKNGPCSFRATPQQASDARRKTQLRLTALGKR